MKKKIQQYPQVLIATILLLFFSTSAYSTILQGTFTGTINYSWENGVWNTYLGQAVTGSVWLDTDLAPADSRDTSDILGWYDSGGTPDWLNISVGFGPDLWDFDGAGEQEVHLTNETYDPSSFFPSPASEWSASATSVGDIYDETFAFARVEVIDPFSTLLSSDVLDQQILAAAWGGEGSVILKFGAVDRLDFTFDITSFSLTEASPPSVPIPAAVWLFGSGLLGLVGVARRKKA